jgi:teichoic acid transport system ATP-binding protein
MKPKVIFNNVTKKFSLFQKRSHLLLDLIGTKDPSKNFYAAKNLSFEVYEGETIGVIGINGSGKSTLSNLLAEVIPPTSGEIIIDGETSLIAISVGLNNHLTGLENIELKCLMHGMKKNQIKELEDLIVEFADVGDFINQPVKNYSSGMKARLGFAISAHTNPDILIIDEALSVGDQTFYEKCLEKINEFKDQGKTIFFISHSLAQIKALSDRVMWIHFGEMKAFGEKNTIIEQYQEFITWFNRLSKEEKKEYRKNNLTSQKQIDSIINNKVNRSDKSKGKKNWSLKIQSLFILILFVFSAATVFIGDFSVLKNLPSFSLKEKDISKDNDLPSENITKINKKGVVIKNESKLFSNKKTTELERQLKFASNVYIIEQINDDTYKIISNEEIGYMNKEDIIILENDLQESDVKIEEFKEVFNTQFIDSYEYFFAFMNTDYEEVKKTLRGLTEEKADDTGKYLVYGYDNVTYLYENNSENNTIIISDINKDFQVENVFPTDSYIKSKNKELYLIKTHSYSILLDKKNNEIRLTPNNIN